MTSIWKFPLALKDEQSVRMPSWTEILTVQFQGAQLCLWALVEVEAPLVSRHFMIFGTGHDVPANEPALTYVGTVQQNGLVWHVFERL